MHVISQVLLVQARDVVQCECQVINGTLQWSAMIPGDPQIEDVILQLIHSFPVQECLHLLVHILQFCVVQLGTSPVSITLTSKLTGTSISTVDVTCRGGGNIRLIITVAGKLSKL